MSLAGMLLNGGSYVSEGTSINDINEMASSIHAIATESWMDTALESLVSDIYTVDKAYHAADVIAEVQVISEGADPAILMEGIVSSGIGKIKEAFKKFWAKLKSWFAEIKRQFKIIFMSGKKFIDEFKSEINKKDEKNFTYTGREYNIDNGDSAANSVLENVIKIVGSKFQKSDLSSGTVDSLKSYSDTVSKDGYGDSYKNAKINSGDESKYGKSQSDMQDEYIKDLGTPAGMSKASDIDELRDNLIEVYHNKNDADYTTSIEGFEGTSKSEMVTFVGSFDKKIRDIEKDENKFDSALNKIIKALDSLDKDKNLGKNDDAYKVVQWNSRCCSALLAIGKVATSVKQSMYKEANSQFERVLKQFLRWKPAKESYGADETVTESLLDQAMSMMNF